MMTDLKDFELALSELIDTYRGSAEKEEILDGLQRQAENVGEYWPNVKPEPAPEPEEPEGEPEDPAVA